MKTGIILLLTTTCFCALVSEILLRMMFSDPLKEQRYYFASSPTLQRAQDGAVFYLPNQQIREVFVYDEKIEYDYTYPTNNLGLIDTIDYPEVLTDSKNSLALVGDSFTAGVGGGAWVANLREKLQQVDRNLQIYNLGVVGAGIEHFYRILKHFEQRLKYSQIILIAISDDFHRLYWYPKVNEKEIRMCPEGEHESICAKRWPMSRLIEANATRSDIDLAVKSFKSWREQQESKSSYLEKSRFIGLLLKAIQDQPLFIMAEKRQELGSMLKNYMYQKNLDWLETIVKAYPTKQITLIHLPIREEIKNNRFDIELEPSLKKIGVTYLSGLELCGLQEQDYHINDRHPNNAGYDKITTCSERIIRELISPSLT